MIKIECDVCGVLVVVDAVEAVNTYELKIRDRHAPRDLGDWLYRDLCQKCAKIVSKMIERLKSEQAVERLPGVLG